MKLLNKKVNDCVQHIILQKFTNFHAIRSWNFQNICNEIGWPRFLRHPVCTDIAYTVNCQSTGDAETHLRHYWNFKDKPKVRNLNMKHNMHV